MTGRVASTVVDGRAVAPTRCDGRLGALENRCPHQGGPVGEGSIENGWLRCPAARGRTVGDAVVETLVAHGELRYVGIRHEGAAAFAASAYGKLTGRPAACFAIAGPGSTNLLTGLYDAKLDGSPVLALSGQVPSSVLGRGAFQDVDLQAVFRDVSAWNATVSAGSDPAELAAPAAATPVGRPPGWAPASWAAAAPRWPAG